MMQRLQGSRFKFLLTVALYILCFGISAILVLGILLLTSDLLGMLVAALHELSMELVQSQETC